MTFEIGPCYGGVLHEKLLLRLTPSKVEDSSTGPILYINSAGEIVTVPSEQALYFDGGFWSVGSWTQRCAKPLTPDLMLLSSAIRTATGNIKGSFAEYAITDTGGLNNGIRLLAAYYQGTGDQYVCIAYNLGTSGKIGIVAYDSTADLSSYSERSNGVWSAVSDYAGEIEIKDDYEHPSGFRVVLFKIKWIYPTHTLYISASPRSTNGSNFLIYACPYINQLGHIWPMTGIGNTTTTSRAGTIAVSIVPGSILGNLLNGSKDFKLTLSWKVARPSIDFPVSSSRSILHSGSHTFLGFRTDASGNGEIFLSDGINEAVAAIDWEYNTLYDIQVNVGWNSTQLAKKMQLIVGSTVSSLSSFNGSFGPDTEMTFGYNTDETQFITKPIFYTLKQSDWR